MSTSTGCYGYFNSPPESIQPGEEIRVLLSESSPMRAAPSLPAALRQSYLDGDLMSLTNDSAALAVWIGQSFRGTQFETAHQTVTLPRAQILGFQRRELSTWRTAGATIAVVGFAVALISRVGFDEDPNAGGTRNPPPPPPGDGAVGIRIFPALRMLWR